jgi:hypothetical protein
MFTLTRVLIKFELKAISSLSSYYDTNINRLHYLNLVISKVPEGPGGSMSNVVGLPNNSYKPITITAWVRTRLCELQLEAPRSL